jgi:hypothetical protein
VLDTTTFKPGAYTFTSTNAGSFKHNLTIDGPGVEDEKTETIDPGKTAWSPSPWPRNLRGLLQHSHPQGQGNGHDDHRRLSDDRVVL